MKKVLLVLLVFTQFVFSALGQKPVQNGAALAYRIKAKHQIGDEVKFVGTQVESPLMILTLDEKMDNPLTAKSASDKMKIDSALKYLNVLIAPINQGNPNNTHTIKLIVPEPKILKITHSISELDLNDTVFAYTCDSRIQLLKNDGTKHLDVEVYPGTPVQVVYKWHLLLSPEFKLKLMLNKKKPEKQKELIEKSISREVYFNTLKQAGTVLRDECMEVGENIAISIFSAKGSDDYKNLDEIALQLKDAINKTTAISSKKAVSTDSVKAMFAKAIPVWENELKLENKSDEKARINATVGNALRYNLAVAYLWSGDLAKAKENIKLVPESEYKTKEIVMEGSFKSMAQKLSTLIDKFIASEGRAYIFSTRK